MQQDELTSIPPDEVKALIHTAFREDRVLRQRAREETRAGTDAAIGVFGADADRRVLFLATVGRHIIENGTDWTQRWLRRRYKFPPSNARDVISEARREMTGVLQSTTDELRALAEHRLEDFIRRARVAVDLDAEIKGHKEWLRLHGLLRIDASGGSRGELLDLMRRVCEEDAGGGPEVIDAEFTTTGESNGEVVPWEPPRDFKLEVKQGDKDDDGN